MSAVGRLIYFLAGFFQDDRPQSFSRGITFVIVSFVLGWDTASLKFTHALPDMTTMGGQIAFMTAFYLVNKGAGAYTTAKGNPPPPQGQ